MMMMMMMLMMNYRRYGFNTYLIIFRYVLIGWFWLKTLKGREYLEGLGLDGRTKLNWISKEQDGCAGWTDLVQDRDKLRAFVKTAMNLLFPQNVKNFLNI
jgi:hypothetical protein